MTKRTFIQTLTLLLLLLSSANMSAQQALPDPATLLRSGPMLGYSEMTETVIWLQTHRPCRAQIRYWKVGKPESAKLSAEVKTDAANDLIARFIISGLEFGSRYDYEVYLEGQRLAFPYPTIFQTQPMWRYRTDPPSFRLAIGSCAFINESYFDRPGKPYGEGYEVFTAIAATKPDLMLWLGDNLYYREADALTEAAMRYRNARNREVVEIKPLLAATHNYAIWDDHDYGPNDADRSFRLKETSLKIFKDYWANNTYGTRETPGVFGRFEWGDVEFFLLDDRYHRSPNRFPKGVDNVMFGEAQMRWLMESLASSQATFKVIAGGNQMMNPMAPYESFTNFPNEQKRLIDFLREAKISGVVFVSGDRHVAELIKRVEPGLYPLYDFTSSPLTAGNARNEREANNPARVPGTWVTEVKNFGLLEFSGPARDRMLTIRAIDRTGKEWWKHEIKASELQFPK